MEGLRIYFRQHQLVDVDTGMINVVVDCATIASYVPGNVPKPDWIEMTGFTDGLEKLQLSWDHVNQSDTNSTSNPTGSNYDKGISLDLSFYGDAFYYIWDWLLTTQCQILNAIDVRIDDVICGKSFRLFEIKCDNLTYRPYDECRMDVKLREQDLVWHCVHKTFIWDNWQGWFNQDGTSTKVHPTFLTCIEPRPRLLNSARMALLLFFHSNPFLALIDFLTAGNIKDDVRKILELENFVPAPLIRDYIDNVAGKCGLTTDTMFHRVGTPEYNACIFHPLGGQMYKNSDDDESSPSTAFIFENRWDITLAEFLDKLKGVYCAEWYVTPNNTIVFKPQAELIAVAPIYDFTTGAIKMNSDLEYTFDGNKKAAYGRYQYGTDGSDLGSQEISNLYNDLVDYDGPSNNPMLEGEKDKQFEFAPTAFIRDGRTKDYIRLLIDDGETGALILLTIVFVLVFYATVLAPAMGVGGFPNGGGAVALAALLGYYIGWAALIAAKASNMKDHFCDGDNNYTGAVRLVCGNQTMTPRILVWDGENVDRARVVVSHPGTSPYYNPGAVPYENNNSIAENNTPLNVFNYHTYFDSLYTGNLFDRFHDVIDNPLKSLETNQSFSFSTDLCCDAMDLLGLWEGDFVKIGYVLKLETRNNYDVLGRIEHVDVDYSGYTIKIKGKVIKR